MEIPGYKIQHQVGQGGMATVYLATQESLERSVVLKVLDINGPTANESLIERFLSEGRIVATLNHPHIITIYDIGIANDALYISMEYIGGGDLKTRMELPMTPDEALEIIAKVTSGLEAAHKMGVVHRDIKPGNIMFRDDNTPLITDFGIAKQTDTIDNDLTSTGLFLGSPNYVSPEQADGIEIDGRADIYSLGCMFYEMLTGNKPYSASTVFDVIIQHKQGPIPTLEDGLEDFQPLLDKMMAKDRKDRFADATEMLSSIHKFQTKRKISATDTDFDVTGVIPKENKGHKSNQTLNILLLLLMCAGGIFGTLQYAETRMNTAQPDYAHVPTDINLPNISSGIDSANGLVIDTNNQTQTSTQVTDDVIQALHWLGKKSLEEYRLTHPPKDNAYYYYSRLLEAEPDDKVAAAGMLNIADRYAHLAERALLENDYKKTQAYTDIGLKFNLNHETLLRLKNLNLEVEEKSLMEKIKALF